MIYLDPTKVRRYTPLQDSTCSVCGARFGEHEPSGSITHPYVAPPSPTTFLWRLMPYRRYCDLQALSVERPEVAPAARGSPPPAPSLTRYTLNTGTVELAVLLECLVGVENLKDEDGKDVAYPAAASERERWLSGLAPTLRRELAEEFSYAHELTESDRGK